MRFGIEFSDGSLSSLRSCTSVYTPVVCRTSEVLGDVLKRYHVIDLLLYVRFFMYTAVANQFPAQHFISPEATLCVWSFFGGCAKVLSGH